MLTTRSITLAASIALAFLTLNSSAEAKRFKRHHNPAAISQFHPDCNILFPCVGAPAPVYASNNSPLAIAPYSRRNKGETLNTFRNARVNPIVTATHVARNIRGYASAIVVGGRPPGCPYQYCGCYTSLRVFGKIIPHLNLARNWYGFPRAAPAAGMAEVIGNHHVRYIEADLGGGIYRFGDGNSGRHLTRIHEGPIRGVVVNPHGGSRFASAFN